MHRLLDQFGQECKLTECCWWTYWNFVEGIMRCSNLGWTKYDVTEGLKLPTSHITLNTKPWRKFSWIRRFGWNMNTGLTDQVGKERESKNFHFQQRRSHDHSPVASANVPCGNWFWLPVWGFTITLLSRVYFAWTSTTPSMSTVIWGHPEFTSSPKSSGNWNKTPGSMTRFWDIFEMDLEKEKELMWVWNVRVKQN